MAKNLRTGLRQSIKASGKAGVTGGGIFSLAPLDLRFAQLKTLDSRVTFTRASSGTYVGADGLVKSASTNEARFDHNPTTGESLGLLVEEARTNLVLQSEDLSTSWTNINTTETTNAATAPDGTTTADKLVETATTTEHSIRQDSTSQAAGTYTFSIFAKAAERTFLQFAATGVLGSFRANFNIGAGTLGSSDPELITSIIPYGNGWYKCIVTRTTTAAGTLRSQWNIVTSSTAARVESYAGDGTSGLLLWGAQLEAGAFPTSYIPTTTATVTRAADVASITGTNFSSWYNQTAGTSLIELREVDRTGSRTPRSFSDGTTSNRIDAFFTSSLTVSTRLLVSGSAYNPGNLTLLAAGTVNKHVISMATGSAISVANGTLSTESTPPSLPVVNRLVIGADSVGGTPFTGTIKRLTYWPVRLANPTLQSITTP